MNFHQGKCRFGKAINQLFLEVNGHTRALTAVGLGLVSHCGTGRTASQPSTLWASTA